ncbi:MAG: MIP family channel protein [Chloroflexia bacterium]|nr:MIP family channel protein [Chloroflexia bacterium]
MTHLNRLAAEAIGTFALVFAGTSAIVADVETGALGHVGVALTFAFAVMVMVYAIGHISGCHINPAVTLGLAATGRFSPRMVPFYWGAQLIGAFVASLLVLAIHGDIADLGTNQPAGSDLQSFWLEIILTFLLVFVICGVATDDRAPVAATGLAIGGTLLLDALFGGPISGASMNPARSLAPAVVSGTWGSLWVYLTAPFIGGVLGAAAYAAIRGAPDTATSTREGESV